MTSSEKDVSHFVCVSGETQWEKVLTLRALGRVWRQRQSLEGLVNCLEALFIKLALEASPLSNHGLIGCEPVFQLVEVAFSRKVL